MKQLFYFFLFLFSVYACAETQPNREVLKDSMNTKSASAEREVNERMIFRNPDTSVTVWQSDSLKLRLYYLSYGRTINQEYVEDSVNYYVEDQKTGSFVAVNDPTLNATINRVTGMRTPDTVVLQRVSLTENTSGVLVKYRAYWWAGAAGIGGAETSVEKIDIVHVSSGQLIFELYTHFHNYQQYTRVDTNNSSTALTDSVGCDSDFDFTYINPGKIIVKNKRKEPSCKGEKHPEGVYVYTVDRFVKIR